MASLRPLVLLYIQLVTLHFEFAVSTETTLDTNCTTPGQCKDGNSTCLNNICKCKDAFYRDTTNRCTPRIYPNMSCAYGAVDDPCVTNSNCSVSAGRLCVCFKNYISLPTRCIQVPTVKTPVQTPVQKYTPKITSHSKGMQAPTAETQMPTSVPKYTTKITSNSKGIQGPTAETPVPTPVLKYTTTITSNSKGLEVSHTDSSSPTVQPRVPKSSIGLEISHTDSSGPSVQPTVPKYSKGNSAATIAGVGITAFILCFMLAYFNVPN